MSERLSYIIRRFSERLSLNEKQTRYASFFIICISIVIYSNNFIQTATQKMWLDEIYTLVLIQGENPLSLIRIMYQGADTNPPLYFVSANIINNLIGYPEYSLAVFGLIFTLGGLYFINKTVKLYDPGIPAYLILLIAATSCHISCYLSTEIRSYGLYFFLSSLIIWLYLKNGNSGKDHILVFAVTSLILYTHYFATVLVISLSVHSLFNLRTRRNILFAMIGGSLLFVPWIPAVINQYHKVGASSWHSFTGWAGFFDLFRYVMGGAGFLFFLFLIMINARKILNIIKMDSEKLCMRLLLVLSLLAPFFYLLLYLNVTVMSFRYFQFSVVSLLLIYVIILHKLLNKRLVYYSPLLILSWLIAFKGYNNFEHSESIRVEQAVNYEKHRIPVILSTPHEFLPVKYYASEKSLIYCLNDSLAVKDQYRRTGKFTVDYHILKTYSEFGKISGLTTLEELKKKEEFYITVDENSAVIDFLSDSHTFRKIDDNFYMLSKKTKTDL